MNILFKIISLPKKIYKFLIFISILLISILDLRLVLFYLALISLMYFLLEIDFINKIYKYNKENYMKKLILVLFLLSISESIFTILHINYNTTDMFSLRSTVNVIIILVIGLLSRKFEK